MLSLDLMLYFFLIPVHSDTSVTLLYLWVFLHLVMETSRKCTQTTKRHLKTHVISHCAAQINAWLLLYSRFWYSHTQANRFRAQPHSSLALCQRSFLFQFIREFHEPVTSAEIQNNSYKTNTKKPLFFLIFTVKSKLVLKNTANETRLLGLPLLLVEMKQFHLPAASAKCLKPYAQASALLSRA